MTGRPCESLVLKPKNIVEVIFMIMRIPILKSILRNLDWFEEARRHHVAPDGSILLGGTNHRLKKDGDWEESKHPRADDGKFTSGSGGGSKKPSKTKRKLERHAEAASQGRVSGAIQTLLSGGSALDKIGWLNTSKPQQPEKPKLPYQELLDQPLPNDHYKLVDLLDKIKDTDERPVKGFEFPKDDPRYTKLKEIRAKIREIDAQTGATARNMAAQQEMDIMEGGREFENPSAYRSWAPPKYRPGPRETKPISAREAPKPTSAPASTNMPESKPVPSAETPKNPNAGNGSPATFEEMFGKSPDHIKVSGSIDHTKPFVLTVEGKTFDHRERLKALGFKYSSANKNWYKGFVPPEGKDAKNDLLSHIKEVSSEPGATSQLRAKVQQGKLVPKKRTMSASEAALFGVKR